MKERTIGREGRRGRPGGSHAYPRYVGARGGEGGGRRRQRASSTAATGGGEETDGVDDSELLGLIPSAGRERTTRRSFCSASICSATLLAAATARDGGGAASATELARVRVRSGKRGEWVVGRERAGGMAIVLATVATGTKPGRYFRLSPVVPTRPSKTRGLLELF